MEIILEFNKKQYKVPADIEEYLHILDITEHIHEALLSNFLEKSNSAMYCAGIVSQKEMQKSFEKAAEKYIERLCKKGIYDQTVYDFVFSNNGYENYSNACDLAYQAINQYSSEQDHDYQRKAKSAERNALSQITGSGVNVYSSSFLTLAMSSAVEYSTLKGQYNKANEQYKEELKNLQKKGDIDRKRKENYYCNYVYRPSIEKALLEFSYELMKRYLECLIGNKLFDEDALKYVKLDRSQKLLSNLTISPDKDAVLEKAFLACPFNIEVYANLINLGKFDEQTYQTIKKLNQQSILKKYLETEFLKVRYTGNIYEDLAPVEETISTLAMISGRSPTYYYNMFAHTRIDEVANQYVPVKNYASNKLECMKILEETKCDIADLTNKKLHSLAEKRVTHIISSEEFEAIQDKCQNSKLLEKIQPQDSTYTTKEDVDKYYIEMIFNNLQSLTREIIDTVELKKQETEKQINKLKSKKALALVIFFLYALLVAFAFYSFAKSLSLATIIIYSVFAGIGLLELLWYLGNCKGEDKEILKDHNIILKF